MLHEFIRINRDEIVRRCRARVATRSLPPPTEIEIDHGVPLFLDQLIDALRLGRSSSAEIGRTAVLHGHDLLLQGFTLSQVVHDYGDVCQSITELAVEANAPIGADDFRMLNGCLDNAIAGAVTQYGSERQESTMVSGTARENERVGFLVHELRNLVQTAIFAFEVVKSGNVGVAGSTGTVLYRSLMGARDLLTRSVAAVRLTEGSQHPEQFRVAQAHRCAGTRRNARGQRRRHQADRSAHRPGNRALRRPSDPLGRGDESPAERLQVHAPANRRHPARRREQRARPDRSPG